MKPICTVACNSELGAPVGWDETKLGKCTSLPVHRDASLCLLYSWWALTWRERLGLLFGKSVRLAIVGSMMPPVALDVDSLCEVKSCDSLQVLP
jgi:hypothetical protein